MFSSSCSASYSNATANVNSLATVKQCYRSIMVADRKSLLRKLIDTRFDGKQAAFARAIRKSPNQVNQWLTGYRSVGDGVARNIETILGLGALWFDGKESAAPPTPAISSMQPESLLSEAIKLLAAMPQEDAEVWILKLTGHANIARAEKRAAETKARQQREEDRRVDIQPYDPHQERRRARAKG